MMVVPCREFVNIHNSDPKEPHYELSNQYTGHPTSETNKPRGVELPGEPNTMQNRPQSACSLSSTTLSVDYATCMEVQNGTWTEQMDVVEEGLDTSIHTTYPIGPTSLTPYTFALQEQSIHLLYTYAEPQPSKETITNGHLLICELMI